MRYAPGRNPFEEWVYNEADIDSAKVVWARDMSPAENDELIHYFKDLAGYERHFGFRLENQSLDTMDLTLHLEKEGAFAGQERIRSFSLDALCGLFGVVPHDRHTAPGDAFLTALVFQRLLRLAARHGRTTLDRLAEPWTPEGDEAMA